MTVDGQRLPRGAIIRYRELYGASAPNVGLKQPAEQVARLDQAARRWRRHHLLRPRPGGLRGDHSGPSIGETFARAGVYFRPADNSRLSTTKRMGGWDQVRHASAATAMATR